MKVVAVTGGHGILGAAVAAHLANAHCRVVTIDAAPDAASASNAPEVALRLGGVDLNDGDQAARAFREVQDRFGTLHGLVNVVGGFHYERVAAGTIGTWDRLYRLNLRSIVMACQLALPLMSRGGAIVNIGANASVRGGAGMAAYAATKSGVSRLTESLAEEMKEAGIRVNAVLPSIIDTPANRADMPAADPERWVRPEAISRVIAFLLSDEAEAITGALLPVTGRT